MMLTTYLIVLFVFLLAFAGMAIGVILSNRRIQGSCGGMAGLKDATGHPMCESCTTPAENCPGSELRREVQERGARG